MCLHTFSASLTLVLTLEGSRDTWTWDTRISFLESFSTIPSEWVKQLIIPFSIRYKSLEEKEENMLAHFSFFSFLEFANIVFVFLFESTTLYSFESQCESSRDFRFHFYRQVNVVKETRERNIFFFALSVDVYDSSRHVCSLGFRLLF